MCCFSIISEILDRNLILLYNRCYLSSLGVKVMSINLTNFIIYFLIIIDFSKKNVIRADIVAGQCPVVKSTPYDCKKILKLFSNESELYAKFYIMAILKSSKEFKKLDIFAFNFDSDLLGFYKVKVVCRNLKYLYLDDWMDVSCEFIEHGPHFSLKPELDNSITVTSKSKYDDCANVNEVNENFKLFTYMSSDVLAFHGCKMINRTHVERGLMVLEPTHKHIQNINETLAKTFYDMNLGLLSVLEEKLIINKMENVTNIENESRLSICRDQKYYYICNSTFKTSKTYI